MDVELVKTSHFVAKQLPLSFAKSVGSCVVTPPPPHSNQVRQAVAKHCSILLKCSLNAVECTDSTVIKHEQNQLFRLKGLTID